MLKLDRVLRNGGTVGFAMRQTGLSLLRVKRYQSCMTGLPRLCGCGDKWNHQNSCWWKVNSILRDKKALADLRQLRRALLALQDVLEVISQERDCRAVAL